jgi:hypothetical protein
MHPCTSYCPATRSPRESLGANEYRVPHWVQTPSGHPDWPSRARPTGLWHSRLPQNRLASGTCGSVMIAAAGSPFGTGGIATIPAPRRPRALADFDDLAGAICTDRAVELPRTVAVAGICGPAVVGALPHTSQSPSTTAPPHPGSAHLIVSPHTAPRAGRATVRGFAAERRKGAATFHRRESAPRHR